MSTSKNADSALLSVSEKNDFDLKKKIISKSIVEKMSDKTRTNQEQGEAIARLSEKVRRLETELKYSRNETENLKQVVRGEAPMPSPRAAHHNHHLGLSR
jgi:hypothetical protein